MCKFCDYGSDDCRIYQDGVGDWYLEHQTGEWDIYEDDFVHDRIYINYCPFCGERLGKIMKYVCSKRMKTKTISGEVNFPVGTVFNCVDGLITHNGKAICYDHSQNAYDYLSCDDDGFGIRRGQLVRDIMGRLKKRDDDYQARWDRIWMDKSLQKYKRTEFLDFWLWNYDFFNAPIGELEYILARVRGEVEPRDGVTEDFMDETVVEDGEA